MAYTDDAIKWVHNRTGGRCFYCGKPLTLPHHDLIAEWGAWVINCFIPQSKNGADCRENWVPACFLCNTVKGACLPWEFDSRRFRQGDENPDNYLLKKAEVFPD